MSLASNLISVIRRITIVIVVAIAFLFGVVTTVYLSLRSPEVKVPDILGKDRFEAEKILEEADLKFRVRATRPSNQTKPDTVLFQLPRSGEVVKAGQTVAMDVSRVAKEGESTEVVKPVENDTPNSNTNTSSTNTNENKPKPKPKNTNSNANSNSNNANANANKNANSNRQANVNRSNTNTINVNVSPRNPVNSNSNLRPTGTNQNVNRRPVAPKPTPASTNSNRPPR